MKNKSSIDIPEWAVGDTYTDGSGAEWIITRVWTDKDIGEYHAGDYEVINKLTGERKTLRKLAQPTALSRIDDLRESLTHRLGYCPAACGCDLYDADKEASPEELNMIMELISAHIAEHYVPKAEVKELDEILVGLEQYNLGDDPITDEPFTAEETMLVYPELRTAKQQIEALIQNAVTNELHNVYDNINTGNVYLALGKIKTRIKALNTKGEN